LDALILLTPRWDMVFHVHVDVLNLVVKAMLAQNPIGKCDQLITYVLRLLNNVKKNYTTTKREALTMVYAVHKFKHYLLGDKFIFYVDHMALLYLVKKLQLLGQIAKWLFLFLKYNLLVVYKPKGFHYVANAFLRLHDVTKNSGIPDKTIDTPLFVL
jgi:hypothetical protein